LLEQLKQTTYLANIIDISQVENMLLDYRTGYAQNYSPGVHYRNTEAHQLFSLFTFVNWHQRVNSHVLQQNISP
jgi:hypothetical protein